MAKKRGGIKRKEPKRKATLSKIKNLSWPKKGYLACILSILAVLGLSLLSFTLRFLVHQPWKIKGDVEVAPRLSLNPRSAREHLVLAKQLLDLNDPHRALEELKIIQELGTFPSGYPEIYDSVQTKAQIKKQLAKDQEYWQKITKTRPQYRDGWYQLGVLSWLLGDNLEGKRALTQALVLDPNFEPAKNLLEKIQ
jgi:tetratricopeptide (TPR) repeat protein